MTCTHEELAEELERMNEALRVYDPHGVVTIYNPGEGWDRNLVRFGVSWASIGTVDPSEGMRFASAVAVASGMAAASDLNGCRVVYVE